MLIPFRIPVIRTKPLRPQDKGRGNPASSGKVIKIILTFLSLGAPYRTVVSIRMRCLLNIQIIFTMCQCSVTTVAIHPSVINYEIGISVAHQRQHKRRSFFKFSPQHTHNCTKRIFKEALLKWPIQVKLYFWAIAAEV